MLQLASKATKRKDCVRAQVSRMERVQMSYDSERLVAKVNKGMKTAHRDPVDVITKTEAIEVKCFHKQAKIHRCKMTREAIERKELYCKKHGLKGKTVMAVTNDFIELYERVGFGEYTRNSMKYVGRYKKPTYATTGQVTEVAPALEDITPATTLKEAEEKFERLFHRKPGALYNRLSKTKKTNYLNSLNSQNAYLRNKYKVFRKGTGEIDFVDGDTDFAGRTYAEPRNIEYQTIQMHYKASAKTPFTKEVGKVKKTSRYTVTGNDTNIVYRHEAGHTAYYHAMNENRSLIGEWTRAYKAIDKKKIKSYVSEYATTHSSECFAESFAIYSSPEYVTGSLNKALGYDVESIIEKILSLEP